MHDGPSGRKACNFLIKVGFLNRIIADDFSPQTSFFTVNMSDPKAASDVDSEDDQDVVKGEDDEPCA